MPLADQLAVLAVERPAEMQADIGGGTDTLAAAPDMDLAAEERCDQAARLWDVGDFANFVFPWIFPGSMQLNAYRCKCIDRQA